VIWGPAALLELVDGAVVVALAADCLDPEEAELAKVDGVVVGVEVKVEVAVRAVGDAPVLAVTWAAPAVTTTGSQAEAMSAPVTVETA
jgi:hypothetical protein